MRDLIYAITAILIASGGVIYYRLTVDRVVAQEDRPKNTVSMPSRMIRPAFDMAFRVSTKMSNASASMSRRMAGRMSKPLDTGLKRI